MGALVVVGQHLAHVVQQPAPLGELHVEVQLRRHHPGEPGDFLRVLVDVLAVGGAVAHPADQLDQLGVEAVDAGVVGGLLAQLDQLHLQLLLHLDDDLLDPARMDPAVLDQRLERAARDLAADRIEAGDDDGVRACRR